MIMASKCDAEKLPPQQKSAFFSFIKVRATCVPPSGLKEKNVADDKDYSL